MGEDVIELSVEETNKLRAELGLAPLRGAAKAASAPPPPVSVTTSTAATSSNKEMLEMSVEETNELRAKLGLKPLSVKKEDIHKPAVNDGAEKELKERLEKEKLKRQVQQGIASTFGSETLGNSKGNALSWAEKMRTTTETKKAATDGSEKKKKKKKKKAAVSGTTQNYDDADLEGINVSHAVSDFEAGSTTILTLADTSLLKQSEHSSKAVGLNDEEDDQQLENVELADTQVQRDRIRQKRQVEMGMGRAGGYAGYDDDEFEELGGAQGPSRLARGQDLGGSDEKDSGSSGPAAAKKRRGFQIGSSNMHDEEEDASDLFAQHRGKAVSLEQSVADVAASDFMTAEEDAALNPKKKKKEAKFKKKKNKKDKKNKRKVNDEDDDKEDEAPPAVGSILDDLEQTAVVPGKKRKRRRDDDDEQDGTAPASAATAGDGTEQMDAAKRRARFDEIMEKGNEQTAKVFSKPTPSQQDEEVPSIDEEPDDNFLHEALAKARRLKKLREMSSQKPKGAADAVAQAVLDSKKKMNSDKQAASSSTATGGLSFELDETREFTRALRARTDQAERQKAKKQAKLTEFSSVKKEEAPPAEPNDNGDATMLDVGDPVDAAESTQGMAELAKQIEEDEPDPEVATGIDGSSSSATVGRGMAGFVSMLRHTGEISGRNAGREEMRGRAKDTRTYDDYEPLNLNEVVRIGKNATDKDKELASREIKLDYRDEHGRLLTRKEAYRNLCYQFHGHGSSAKNQEKRLRQVEREQAEARLASRQGGGAGSLGALKATQKATGKAFVIHKT
jgi:U4/U6.U5 tri-snRNP-associated protein 1